MLFFKFKGDDNKVCVCVCVLVRMYGTCEELTITYVGRLLVATGLAMKYEDEFVAVLTAPSLISSGRRYIIAK